MGRVRSAAPLVLAVAVLVAGGCSQAAQGPPPEDPHRPTVTITSFDFLESEILAEVYGQALRQAGYPVEVVPRLGPREIVEPALEQGRVDLVPGYLGSGLNFLQEQERVATADPRRTHALLQQGLAARGLRALDYAPAQDRNGFVVTGTMARRHQLERISDLRPIASQLTFGGPPECPGRPLCLKGLQNVYGLEFKQFQPMASRSTTAGALEMGEIDVGMLETTDANLLTHDFVQLEDDRRLQPAENVVPIVRKEILAAYGPALAGAVDAVTAQLNTRDLIHLNQRVQLQGVTPATVAAHWLLGHPASG